MRTSENADLALQVSAQDHADGPASAPLTLVEYGDYECPYCGEAYPILKQVKAQIGDRLRFVFRNFPLTDSHPYAFVAAEAAEAAAGQGQFWAMHDKLYENQSDLGGDALLKYARQIGLDVGLFTKEVNNRTYAQRIEEDFQSGLDSGVNGTPMLFINGQRYDGERSLAAIVYAVESVL